MHVVEPDVRQLRQAIKEGQRFIAYSVDIRMIDLACREGLDYVKELRE
jgi:2-dehydro-3-deoxyglucarate aldolase